MNSTEKRMKTVNTLLTISALGFGVAALGFIAVSIFGEEEGTRSLIMGLGYAAAGTLINVVRMLLNKQYSGADGGDKDAQEHKEDK